MTVGLNQGQSACHAEGLTVRFGGLGPAAGVLPQTRRRASSRQIQTNELSRFVLVIRCSLLREKQDDLPPESSMQDGSLSPPDAKEFEELVQLLEKYEAGQGQGFGPIPEELQVCAADLLLLFCCWCQKECSA